MKFAMCIMDGLEQFVLTPETDTETKLIAVLAEREGQDITIYRGSFYTCQGGWYRQGQGDDSAIITVRPTKEGSVGS